MRSSWNAMSSKLTPGSAASAADQVFSSLWAWENRPASIICTTRANWMAEGGGSAPADHAHSSSAAPRPAAAVRRGLRTAGSTATLPQRGW
ncbi:hypothetical protein G6F35_018638 [Rhizopus arrhizus]|nr:hypothetical protein G6F35_018638 [Rhizopus arrhizus]